MSQPQLFDYLTSVELSDVGRRRARNEDSVKRVPEYGVFCLADGMGGGDAGDVASAMTVEAVAEALRRDLAGRETARATLKCDAISRAIGDAGRRIRQQAFERGRGMSGSTVVVLVFDPVTPQQGTVLHAGDSRLYRYRAGTLEQITRDHSFAAEAGYKSSDQVPAQFRGVVTRAVGIKDEVNLETTRVDVLADDLFLICSDGLSGMVPDKQIRKILKRHEDGDLDALARELIDEANAAGGKDNISVVLVKAGRLVALPPEAAAEGAPHLEPTTEDALPPREPTTEDALPPPTPAPDAAGEPRASDADNETGEDPAAVDPTEDAPPPAGDAYSETATTLTGITRPAEESDPEGGRGNRRLRALLIGAVALGLAIGAIALLRPSAKTRAKAWLPEIVYDIADGQDPGEYLTQLTETQTRLKALLESYAGDRDVEAALERLQSSAAELPRIVDERQAGMAARGSIEGAERLAELWRARADSLAQLGVTAARQSVERVRLEQRVARLRLLDRVKALTADTTFGLEQAKALDAAAGAVRAEGDDDGLRSATLDLKQSALEWCRLAGEAFEAAIEAHDTDALEKMLATWDATGPLEHFGELIGERRTALREAMGHRLGTLMNGLRDDVLRDISDGALSEAESALRTLRGIAYGLRASSFAAIGRTAYSAAAQALDDARPATPGAVMQELERVRAMAKALHAPDADEFTGFQKAYAELKRRSGDGMAARLESLRRDAEETCKALCEGEAASAQRLYEAGELAAGDAAAAPLRAFVQVLTPEFGRADGDQALALLDAGRADAVRQLAEVNRAFREAARTFATQPPAEWGDALKRLANRAALRDLNEQVRAAWNAAAEAFDRGIRQALTAGLDAASGDAARAATLDAIEALLQPREVALLLGNERLAALSERVLAGRTRLDVERALHQLAREAGGMGPAECVTALKAAETAVERLPAEERAELAPLVDAVGVSAARSLEEAPVTTEADVAELTAALRDEACRRRLPPEAYARLMARFPALTAAAGAE